MNILSILKGIFSFSGASDTAVDIVRKVTGTDGLTDKEKAQFVLDYMKATASQSIARRIISVGLFFVYVVFLFAWLYCFFKGNGEQVDHMLVFIKEILLTPFNLILSFYFTINIIKGLGK